MNLMEYVNQRSTSIAKKPIRKLSRDSNSDSSSQGPKRHVKFWTPEEDKLLQQFQRDYDGDWRQVADRLGGGRNPSQCYQRWKRTNPNRVAARSFFVSIPQQEDYQVQRLVQKYGKNWKRIEEEMEGRSGKQIRERWINQLDPEINHEKFSETEDEIVLRHYKKVGPRWSEISKLLKGRPENMVKNRFYTHVKHMCDGQPEELCSDEEPIPEIKSTDPVQGGYQVTIPVKLDTIPSMNESLPRSNFEEMAGSLNGNNSLNEFMLGSCESNKQNRYLMGLTQRKGLGNGSFEDPDIQRPGRRDPFAMDISKCVSIPMPGNEALQQFGYDQTYHQSMQEEIKQPYQGFMSLESQTPY